MATDEPTKHCTGCNTTRPLSEFAFKNKALGKLHSRCKACQRTFNVAHYAANRSARSIELKARRNRIRAERRAELEEIRTAGSCSVCGSRDRALEFRAATGVMSATEAVRSDVSAERYQSAVAASTLICTNCRMLVTRHPDAGVEQIAARSRRPRRPVAAPSTNRTVRPASTRRSRRPARRPTPQSV